MPIYEYACDACGHRFEKLVMTPSTAAGACERCGGERVTRLFSTFSARSGPGPAGGRGPGPRGTGGAGGGCCNPGSCGCN